ncbi:LysR family transcriptional regulator [Aquincola sp. S2]|uniref:LysR family transcriptional regulator n=1 Tax=Pseudaquabacterium terrae TaxID=2732868 RepID=A0ABX2EU32_9BURK|nr:LysR family transcriptional regulator [Aquabacterium terrae]NRF72153.1 LysR family transcriptional regulator [Aquabacterium terrae]
MSLTKRPLPPNAADEAPRLRPVPRDLAREAPRRRPPLPALDANALELFARVVEAGSFAEAARRLGLTRAAVSRRIAAIEAEAGVPLIARTTRSLGLTEAGRRLSASARGVLEAADAARRSMRSGRSALQGVLRITAVATFGRIVLVPLLARFQQLHPEVRYELLMTDRRIDLLREGIDVAFRVTRRPPPDWVAQPVLPLRIGAYAATGPALGGPAELAQQRCMVPMSGADEVMLRWRHDSGGEPVEVAVRPATAGDDIDSLVAMARAGGGIVLAPDYCVQQDLQAGRLIDVLPGWQYPVGDGVCIQALTLPPASAGETARELVKFVREACGAIPDSRAAAAA